MKKLLFFCSFLWVCFTFQNSLLASVPVGLVSQFGGDCRAVDTFGNYAYVGAGPRLLIFDISNPSNPVLVGKTSVLPQVVEDVVVSGNYAYAACGFAGLQIIDISNPTVPVHVSSHNPFGAVSVDIMGQYVYVLSYIEFHYAELDIIDVSNPLAPKGIGSYGFMRCEARDIAVCGQYACIAGGDYGVYIMNVSNPSSPYQTAWLEIAGASGVDICSVYLYITAGTKLEIYDISNAQLPQYRGRCFQGNYAEKVEVFYDYFACVANSSGGLVISDVSSPAAPAIVGTFNTSGNALRVDINDWGNTVLVADSNGLQIIDISQLNAPVSLSRYKTLGYVEHVSYQGPYVYLADSSLRIVDISTPSEPKLLSDYSLNGTTNDFCVQGNYAYRAAYNGLHIFDISDPCRPSPTSVYNPAMEFTHVEVSGCYAYASYWSGMVILDITDSYNPVMLGEYDLDYISGIAVSDNYVYLLKNSNKFYVVDVNDPCSPSYVSEYSSVSSIYDITVKGNYAYIIGEAWDQQCSLSDPVTGECWEWTSWYEHYLEIVDISNPYLPSRVGFWYTVVWDDNPFIYYPQPKEIYVSGDIAYIAYDIDGLLVINVSDPAHPKWIGEFNTSGYAQGVSGFNNYPVVADENGGLVILRAGWPGDLEPDGDIDFDDFRIFALRWLDTGCLKPYGCDGSDLDNNTFINSSDLEILVQNWLNGTAL